MYGDNRNLLITGGGLLLFLLLITLSITSLIKVGRLERVLMENPPQNVVINKNANKAPQQIESKEEVNREQAFFEALDFWESKQEEQRQAEKGIPQLDLEKWQFLDDFGLELEPLSHGGLWSIVEKKANQTTPLIRIEIREKEFLLTPSGSETSSFSSLNSKLIDFIEKESLRLKEEALFQEESAQLLQNLSRDLTFLNLAKRKVCKIIPINIEEEIHALHVVTQAEERVILTLSFDRNSRYINGESISGSAEEYILNVKKGLEQADTRMESEIAHEESLSLIRTMYGDQAFAHYLEEKGLYPQWSVREDYDFSYIDLVDKEGRYQAAFAVKKRSGRIYLVDSQNVPLVSLDSLKAMTIPLLGEGIQSFPEDLAQIDDIYAARDSFTLLLVGYHNTGTDTMILAHVNRDTKKISLISIPRDIWWEGQKINAYYFGYSREALLELMTELTGVQVDYYLAMDMYAFIDVVNAMGGLDIELETSVIDPTYRIIREDGTEGTLYYTPGSYHLNGVEALRLARSRHGSSDFDRSALQQKILSSMKDKISNLSLQDATMFKQFLRIAMDNGETNMTLPFMVKNLLLSRDYTLDSGNTLYDKTVLYNSYSNFYLLSPEEQEKARNNEEFNWGQWILLPVNNDWNRLRVKVREILEIQ
jgi:LCP family protein required for cell wall assembly